MTNAACVNNNRPSFFALAVAYLSVYIIWGSTFLAIRFSVMTIPPLLSGGIRFLTAGVLLLMFRMAKSSCKTTLIGWKNALCAGVFPFTISYGLITAASRFVPSSIAALLVALEPLCFCVLGWLFFKEKKPTKRNYLGMLLGFLGMFLIIFKGSDGDIDFRSEHIFWTVMLAASSLAWVIGAFISKSPNIHEDTLMSSGMQMVCGGGVLVLLQYLYSCFTGDFPDIQNFSAKSIWALVYLIIFGSLVAYTSFLWLMKTEPVSRVSTHAFVNPVVAIFLGWLLADEPVTMGMVAAVPLVLASVWLLIMPGKTSS